MHYLKLCLLLLLLHVTQQHEDTQNVASEDRDYPAPPFYYAPFYGGFNQGDYFSNDEADESAYAENKEVIPLGKKNNNETNHRRSSENEPNYDRLPNSYGNFTETENALIAPIKSGKHHDKELKKQVVSSKREETPKEYTRTDEDDFPENSSNVPENSRDVTESANEYPREDDRQGNYEEKSANTDKVSQRETTPVLREEDRDAENREAEDYEKQQYYPEERNTFYGNNTDNEYDDSRRSVSARSNSTENKYLAQQPVVREFGNTEQRNSTVLDLGFPKDSSSVVDADKEQLQGVSQYYGAQMIPGDLPSADEIAKEMNTNEEAITVDQYPANKDFVPPSIVTERGSVRHRIYSRKQQQLKKHVWKVHHNKAVDRHADDPITLVKPKQSKPHKNKNTSGLSKNDHVTTKMKPRVNTKAKQQHKEAAGSHFKTIPASQSRIHKTPKLKDPAIRKPKTSTPKKTKTKTLKNQQQKFKTSTDSKIKTVPMHNITYSPVLSVKKNPISHGNPKNKTGLQMDSNTKTHHAQKNISSATLKEKTNKPKNATLTANSQTVKPQVNIEKNTKATQRNLKTTTKEKPESSQSKGKSRHNKKVTKKESKPDKKRKIGGCNNYLGCLESWFDKYSVHLKPMSSVSKLQSFFTDIYKSDFMVSFKSEVKSIVQKLSEMRLINWAIPYDLRPKLASWMNIEFLRMPLGLETPANLKQSIVFKRILALKEKQDAVKEKVRALKNSVSKGNLPYNIQCQVNNSLTKYRFLEESMENLRDNATISEIYQDEAPALSVSGYDRNSYVWSQCAPKEANSDIYAGMYQKLMDMNSYQCVLYAFMKCVHDMEKEGRLKSYRVENKKRQGSFERYKKGFESLIQLHYDYGAKQNKLVPIDSNSSFSMERLTSAYCESPEPVQCLQEDGVATESAQKFEDSYYCQNYFGCYITCGQSCLLRERNLLPDERDRLMSWLSRDQLKRRQAATELWNECCSNIQNCLPLKPPY